MTIKWKWAPWPGQVGSMLMLELLSTDMHPILGSVSNAIRFEVTESLDMVVVIGKLVCK